MTSQEATGSGNGRMAFLLGMGFVVAAALLYRQLPEIRRYLRMERM